MCVQHPLPLPSRHLSHRMVDAGTWFALCSSGSPPSGCLGASAPQQCGGRSPPFFCRSCRLASPGCVDPLTYWTCHTKCHALGGSWFNEPNPNHPDIIACKKRCATLCPPSPSPPLPSPPPPSPPLPSSPCVDKPYEKRKTNRCGSYNPNKKQRCRRPAARARQRRRRRRRRRRRPARRCRRPARRHRRRRRRHHHRRCRRRRRRLMTAEARKAWWPCGRAASIA